MGKNIYIALIMIFFACFCSVAQEDRTVIIIPDAVTSGINLSTSKSISSFAIDLFIQSQRFTVVDRKNLDKSLNELALQMSGLTNPENIKKVGSFLNADKFVHVNVSRTGGISLVDSEEQFIVKIGIDDIETNTVEFSRSEKVNGTDQIYVSLKKMITEISGKAPLIVRVTAISGNALYLNRGSSGGIMKNVKYDVRATTKVVKDKAGKIVFSKKGIVGKIKISDLNADSSEAEIIQSDNFKFIDGMVVELIKLH